MNVKLWLFLMQKPGTIILFSNQYSQETQIQTRIDDEHQAIFDAYKNGDIEKAAQMMKNHLDNSLFPDSNFCNISTNKKFVTLFFQHNSLFVCLNILCGRVNRKKCNIHNYKNNIYNNDYCKGYSYRFPYSFTLTISDCHLFSNMC